MIYNYKAIAIFQASQSCLLLLLDTHAGSDITLDLEAVDIPSAQPQHLDAIFSEVGLWENIKGIDTDKSPSTG